MNLRSLIPTRTQETTAQADTLESLIATAESYGTLSISGVKAEDDRAAGYYVRITFDTDANITLEAKSDFRVPLVTALQQAIERAEKIRGQFK
ncbi:hypothetical protein [Nostoc phage Nsp-JY21]